MKKAGQGDRKSPRNPEKRCLLDRRRGPQRSIPKSEATVPSKAAAKALEARLIRRTEVLQQVATAILLADAQGIVTYFNPAFERVCGEGCRQILGQSIPHLSREGWEPEILGPLSEIIQTGRPGRRFLLRPGRDGNRKWEMRISPLAKSKDDISGYVVSMRDVTDEHRIEGRLRQVQKMEALGNLARGIAHDLNNIFSPIIVNMELLLRESGKEPRERTYLEQALTAARRGKDLVDRITMFGRGGEGGRIIVSLGALIDDALKILKPTVPTGITIELRMEAEDDRISAQPAQIHQLLMNLFGNAVQAMARGGVLTIGLAAANGVEDIELAAGPFLELRVEDTGCGVAPDIKNRIFEPFFTTKSGGSGMGLAVVHGIVRNLGGTIIVDSEPNQGAVFRVFLPRATPAERSMPRRPKPGAKES